jgi:DNA-binding MarR family transcriptional regulator
MDTRWLDDRERAAWVRLVGVFELLPGALDSSLRRNNGLTRFEYFSLAMLSEDPQRTLRMTALATQTNSTLPRLSHVMRRLEDRGLVERIPSPEDGRATDVRLTTAGLALVQAAAPHHVANVRRLVIDALSPEQVTQLADISEAILRRLDPDGKMAATYHRYDPDDGEDEGDEGSDGGTWPA